MDYYFSALLTLSLGRFYFVFLINIILSYKMTTASFYKQGEKGSSNGIYFDIPEDQLGKELQKRKN